MNETAIAWTDYTFNFFSGCKKISPECAHCYAHTLAERHRGDRAFPHGFDLTVREHKLAEPRKLLKSKGPMLIFCESMSDIGLDDAELSAEERARLNQSGFARTWDEMPTVPGAMPERRESLSAPTAGLARKLPVL